ncbi:MAG: hypothetical protein IPG70_13360 [Moraxellaceae bacterium]|nr:hypothetical protein [Moraxellaceae bacterium]
MSALHSAIKEFFIKLGQQIIRLFDQANRRWFVFRIDMRLRPWGDGSALALSFAAMERYYEAMAANGALCLY